MTLSKASVGTSTNIIQDVLPGVNRASEVYGGNSLVETDVMTLIDEKLLEKVGRTDPRASEPQTFLKAH